ncbi:glycosyltransferase family 4 protein [Oceanisphaera psychrotolerans]|nr:glycosyltransferase family 4 protein [Oceanisphaera psychrotolerans]
MFIVVTIPSNAFDLFREGFNVARYIRLNFHSLIVKANWWFCKMIISFISSNKGGGAELLVHELHKIFFSYSADTTTIYFNNSADGLVENEMIMGVNPRSLFNIFRIRSLLKKMLICANDDLVVHVHLTWPFFYVTLASLGLNNIKLIYTEHNTTNKRRRIPLFWLFERLLYSRYSKIICISHGVHESLAKWLGPYLAQRLVTIPNGSRIYTQANRHSLHDRLPRLVSVGSLTSKKKNFATAIRAIAQLRDEVEGYTIIGEGPERSRLEQIIKSERLDNKVQLAGWSDEIEAHLHASDIQLIPSLWEGFGLVAVEGMSTGLPVVASNVAGLCEVLDESNPSVTLINQTDSVDEWVAGIRKAVVDLNRLGISHIAQSSRRQAEKFTLEQMAERYLDVYRQK